MKNFIQPGHTVTIVAPATIASGAGLLIGSMFGIAAFDAAQTSEVELVLEGVFDLPAASGAGTAITAGAKVYWDNTNKVATKTATSNTLIGVLLSDKPDEGTEARVRLNGSF